MASINNSIIQDNQIKENSIILGMQFGDEGKGKIVDYLSPYADIVVRYQGGSNAGHTIVRGEKVYKLHLIPSGIIDNKICVIGSGTVINLTSLIKEINYLREQGIDINPSNLIIDSNAFLLLDTHKLVDSVFEKAQSTNIGTTKEGIGPAYTDKVSRNSLQVKDILYTDYLTERFTQLTEKHKAILKRYNKDSIDIQEQLNSFLNLANQIKDHIKESWLILKEASEDNKRIIFEGAQGAQLDIEHGTYPFVTSSSIYSGYASIGGNFNVNKINRTIGVVKAYTTRVGNGPLYTEIQDESMHSHIATKGREVGTTTGRSRRCGWLDLPMMRKAIFINGVKEIALTKLDVLDELDSINVCTHYKVNNVDSKTPPHQSMLSNCEAQYIQLDGWKCDTFGISNYNNLPENMIKYISFIEKELGVKVSIISTGPDKKHTIML